MFLFVLLFAAFIGINVPYEHVDVDLTPFVNQFDTKVESKCNKLQYYRPIKRSIVFDNLIYPVIGRCTDSLFYYKIQIDHKWWRHAKDEDRYQLVVHEMSHCTFFELHTNDITNYMAPSYLYLTNNEINDQLDDMIRKHCQ